MPAESPALDTRRLAGACIVVRQHAKRDRDASASRCTTRRCATKRSSLRWRTRRDSNSQQPVPKTGTLSS